MKRITFALVCALSLVFAISCNKDPEGGGKENKDDSSKYDVSKDPDFNPSAPAIASTVARIDLGSYWASPVDCWDELHAVTTLQGIVNRNTATIYIDYVKESRYDVDKYWWNKYSSAGGWLSGVSVKTYNTPLELIEAYLDKVKGAVVYDPAVASTSNIASAVAGIENLIAIRYNTNGSSLYTKLVKSGKLPVKVWLVNEDGSSMFTGTGTIPGTELKSTGSKKCDPYYWFIENYIKKGKCNTLWGGYYIDQYWLTCWNKAKGDHHCLTNHDFFVSKKAFFLDLSPWGDEPATDEKTQPSGTDLKTMKDLLLAAYNARKKDTMCYIGGFPSWAHKYTTRDGGIHKDVDTEWEYTRVISQYNACMDADAIAYGAEANSSFWQHFPLKDKYEQKWVTRENLKERGLLKEDGTVNLDNNREYYIFYVGDYDASSWIYQTAWYIWDDPARGSVPLMWAIGPALSQRSPQVMHYFYSTATENDYFVAADNGAGYLNPGELQAPRASGLPSGVTAWKNHCKKFYDQWGMTITGFIIDGFSSQMNDTVLDAYAEFSPNGIVPQKTNSVIALYNGMPILRSSRVLGLGRGDDPVEAGKKLVTQIHDERLKTGQRFHWCRVVLATPTWYKTVVETAKEQNSNYILLDAPSFFELMRIYKEK